VKVASVTGAGDSFVALLALKLAQGRDLQEALCYAVAAAAAAVTTEENNLCRREDVERLYQQMLADNTAVQIQNNGDTLTL
jgi:6-phosphofructokinase 2